MTLSHGTIAATAIAAAAAADPRGVSEMAGCVGANGQHRGCSPSCCFFRCRGCCRCCPGERFFPAAIDALEVEGDPDGNADGDADGEAAAVAATVFLAARFIWS